MNPIMVSFMGLDGSGKSTSVECAHRYLEQKGHQVKTVRAAYVVEYLRPFLEFGKKILLKKDSDPFGGDYRTYLEKMRTKSQSGPAYQVFQALTTLEFRVQISRRIKANLKRETSLMVDRYIYDNVVTYAANTGQGRDYMVNRLATTWAKAPRPDLVIYIDTPIEVCLSRKDDIPDPLYLEVRKPLYDVIARETDAVIIAGDQPREEMELQVIEAVIAAMRRKNPDGA